MFNHTLSIGFMFELKMSRRFNAHCLNDLNFILPRLCQTFFNERLRRDLKSLIFIYLKF